MTETHTRDNLIGGDFPIVTSGETLLDGQTIARGGVVGKITAGTVPSTGTADGGNTGNGTVTVVTGSVAVQVGIYTVKCIEAVAEGGVFIVVNPAGKVIATVAIDPGSGQTGVFTTDELNGTITDGSTDFAFDDFFTVTVPAGSGKLAIVLSTAIDGTAAPYGVSSEAAAPSGADAEITVYQTGQFNEAALTFGGSDTIATHRDAMRALSMFARASVVV